MRSIVEKQAFGVCSWLGGILKMPTAAIRLFFIYASFLAIGSPVIIYMILAFLLKMKDYIWSRRSSVWDL